MPVMGGDELLPILASRFPGVRVICSSGYPQEETLRSKASSVVVGFLQKPYTVSALAEKVKQVLEQCG
jgi:two-component system, cell cycle sensor histidine kinase and response regulator CckA